MHTFNVDDMTCGHCASSITAAVRAEDPNAKVQVDLGNKRVQVESTASAADIESAIREAGYTPKQLRPAEAAPQTPKASGCCCGTPRAKQ